MAKTTKKSGTKKTNNSRSAAAKGYVKETKKVEVETKTEKEVKEAVKTLVREEEPKKEIKKEKKAKKSNIFTKKNICIGVAAIAVVAIVVVLVIVLNNPQKKLEKYMKQLGKVYYEDVYYSSFEKDNERSEFLAKYTTLGIKTDLSNLVRAVASKNGLPTSEEILAKFVNKKTGKECNRSTTKVFFYPEEPYGKNNYRIEVQVECGYEK
jgi:cytochrome oxidase assembly protein ShyY1